MEDSVANAVAEVQRLGKKLAKDLPSEEVEKLTPLLCASIELASKTLLPLLEQVRQLPDAEGAFDKNYLPEALEKIVRLEALIDARISKVLARLVALKEFKRTPAGNPLAQLTGSRSTGVGCSRLDQMMRRKRFSLQTRMVVRNAAEAASRTIWI